MRIGIFGAGAIGGYLGCRLSAAGVPVVLIGRAAIVSSRARLAAHPIGAEPARLAEDAVVSDDPAALAGVDACLITVKSADTGAAADAIGAHLTGSSVVVSLQNGLDNAHRLQSALGGGGGSGGGGVRAALGGIVTYNVVRRPDGILQQATTGKLVVEARDGHEARVADALRRAGEVVDARPDIDDCLAGKLLLNLNNGVCAATGLTIAESLRRRAARRLFSACIREGLDVLRAAGYAPRSLVGLPPAWIARLLGFPDAVVLRVARKLVEVDPEARSSTLQDLMRGRTTEIDALNGAIVALARRHDRAAPVNERVVEVIRRHEQAVIAGRAPEYVPPELLLATG